MKKRIDPNCATPADPSVFTPSLTKTEFYENKIFDFKEIPLWFQSAGPNTIELNKNIFFTPDRDIDRLTTVEIQVLTQDDLKTWLGTGIAFDLFSATVHSRLTISLKKRGSEEFYVRDLPLLMLSRTIRDGKPFRCNMNIDLGQSYITILNTTGLAAGKAILFHFHTEPMKNGNGNDIKNGAAGSGSGSEMI